METQGQPTTGPTARFTASPRTEVVIDYQPGPTAERFLRSTARVKLAYGPVRTGKSVAACWAIFLKSVESARKGIALKSLVLRDTYRNLEDTTLKTWMEWFGQCGRLVRRANVSDFLLRVPGSELEHTVLFRHGQTSQDASSFLSSDYGVIFLEEAAPAYNPSGLVSPGIAEEVFDLALTRLIQKGIDDPVLLITCNPPVPSHWVNRRLIARPVEDLRARNYWSFFFPSKENEHNLRPGYYDELRAALKGKDHILRRFVEGEVVAIYPGYPVFADDFSQSLHVVDDLKPLPDTPLILGFDAGLTPACVWTQIDAHGRWLWLHELQAGYMDERLSTQMGADKFSDLMKLETAREFPGLKVDVVYADPAVDFKSQTDEMTVKRILEAAGFNVQPGEKEIAPRVEGIRERLTALVDGKPGILIKRSGCPLLIEAMSGGYRYGVSRDGTRIHGAEPLKDMYSHLVDGVGYIASILFPPGEYVWLSRGGQRKPPIVTEFDLLG